MTMTDLAPVVAAQLMDPFRIALILGLIYTAQRNAAVTGWIVPLLAGVVFVAVIAPATAVKVAGTPFMVQVATGLVANTIILGIALGLWAIYRRVKG
ncbi:hypothetical protein SAMN04488103_106106 [Gemmobacter aquatilis]|uniref:Uncharacterized protein n=1 Tax=Gemmobacter aquatilis TaxID=933059 RepID=A0A1H8I1Z3_9RHOB|nr:hypothetical protein [Gemmobacter aquatilis]SEN62563.1 hypothetical protein SAMN04488103_106106 [Gemmobacter aquatilis]